MASTMRKLEIGILLRVWGVLVLFVITTSTWSGMPGVGVLAKTYTLSDGDIVTCIFIEDQPSLKVGNPTYNKSPTTKISDANPTAFPDRAAAVAVQTFALEVKSGCPEGTIPVTDRTLGNDQQPGALKRKRRVRESADSDSDDSVFPHEYAIGNANASSSVYKGTEVIINIWNPKVANDREFSLAQLWLLGGDPLNSVEVGYQVYEGLGGDYLSRLFVYWTADDYNVTGCYDLNCTGFVQVSNKVLLRGSFKFVSTEGGKRYEIKLRVFKDSETQDWWLQLNDEYVGYWPAAIYPVDGLYGVAEALQWGGEIFYDRDLDKNRHTTTDMGSGFEGSVKSAYMRNLKYVDSSDRLVDAPFYLFNTSAPCYAAQAGKTARHPDWGSYFYFGGPGYGPRCLKEPNTE